MSIIYQPDHNKGIGYVCWTGTISAAEFLEHTRLNLEGSDWPPKRNLVLIDARYAWVDHTMDETLAGQILQLNHDHQDKGYNLRVAIVATNLFEKAKIFERIASRTSSSVIVFNDLDTACTWLGIDPLGAEQTLQQMRIQERNSSM